MKRLRLRELFGLTALMVLFFFCQSDGKAAAAGEEKIIVIFRIDDYSSISSTEAEIKLIEGFKKHNLPFTIGVIPFAVKSFENTAAQESAPLPKEKAGILKTAAKSGNVEIALHGYSHQTTRWSKTGDFTEFSGVNYNKQLENITKGKIFLEGIFDERISTFIPPWNSYDMNTLLALEKAGFKNISADAMGIEHKTSSLKFIPFTCNILELKEAVHTARQMSGIRPVVITALIHEYDLSEIDAKKSLIAYSDLIQLLEWVSSQNDIRALTVGQAAETAGNKILNAAQYAEYSFYRKLSTLIPPYFGLREYMFHNEIYFPFNAVPALKIKYWAIILTFQLFMFAASCLAAFNIITFIFPRAGQAATIFKFAGLFMLVFLVVYAVYKWPLGYKSLTTLMLSLGTSIGVELSIMTLRKPKEK